MVLRMEPFQQLFYRLDRQTDRQVQTDRKTSSRYKQNLFNKENKFFQENLHGCVRQISKHIIL